MPAGPCSRPSCSHRRWPAGQALVADVAAGRGDRDELPRDVLTMLVEHPDPAWDDELALREVLVYLAGSIRTTARSLVHLTAHLDAWFADHPAIWPGAPTRRFVRAAARRDAAPASGAPRTTPPGHRTAPCSATGASPRRESGSPLLFGTGNRDTAVFGPTANRFDPHRETGHASVPGYGLAFAAGTHTCIGRRLADGDGRLDDRRSGLARDDGPAPATNGRATRSRPRRRPTTTGRSTTSTPTSPSCSIPGARRRRRPARWSDDGRTAGGPRRRRRLVGPARPDRHRAARRLRRPGDQGRAARAPTASAAAPGGVRPQQVERRPRPRRRRRPRRAAPADRARRRVRRVVRRRPGRALRARRRRAAGRGPRAHRLLDHGLRTRRAVARPARATTPSSPPASACIHEVDGPTARSALPRPPGDRLRHRLPRRHRHARRGPRPAASPGPASSSTSRCSTARSSRRR